MGNSELPEKESLTTLEPPAELTDNTYPLKKEDSSFHPTVFIVSAALIILFVVGSLLFREQALTGFDILKNTLARAFDWFFILVVNAFVVVCLYFIFSKRGDIRLGGKQARPDFGYTAWMAMLFSAGMGIGLVFWSVAEPVIHFQNPPLEGIPANSARAANMAMAVTYFHWGLHAWGIYAMMGLALAYYAYNKGLPLTIRSTLYPLLGKRVDGPWGNLVDIVASVATLFGVATSLGFGVKQVNAGLNYAFGLEQSPGMQAVLIAIITALATLSVVSGLEVGIRRLSEINMLLALGLMLFIIFVGPTVFFFDGFVQNLGAYGEHLLELSTWMDTYQSDGWREGWTIFYWAWWIAWSPFVGMFIARISRGRTVREFTLGVLFVPTALTFLWLSVFGNAALFELLNGNTALAEAVNTNVATALFELLKSYPFVKVVSVIAVGVIVLFFVTSSDSGSLVIDIITAGGHTDPPVRQRIFWAVTEGAVAAVLLLVGGEHALTALQTASIATGLPFAVILLFIAYGMLKNLNRVKQPPAVKKATRKSSR